MLTDAEILHLLTLFTEKRDLVVCELCFSQKTWVIKTAWKIGKKLQERIDFGWEIYCYHTLKNLRKYITSDIKS